MDEESPDSPGPAAYKMDDNAEAKIYTRYGKNYIGYENRPSTIHDRKQWEKEDAYKSGVFATKGAKRGPPIGLAHPETGADVPSYSFSGAERFEE
jgi:hypothetical protein